MRVTGILSILFEDIGDVEREAYATIAVDLSLRTEELEESDPDSYGFRKFFPGQQSWRASASYNEVILSDLTQQVAQIALEELAFARTKFAIVFTSAAGRLYTGRAWIPALNFPAGDQSTFWASIEFIGIGELVSSAPPHFLFDPEDLLLYLPESIVGTVGEFLQQWTNLGSQGTIGDLTATVPGSTSPGEIKTDPNIGNTVGFTDNDESKSTAGIDVVSPIDGDFDSEIWIILKTQASVSDPGRICAFGFGGPSTGWDQTGDNFRFTTGSATKFTSPSIYGDSSWHVFRSIHNLVGASNSLSFEVDGYPLGSNTLTGGLTRLGDETFAIGPFDTGSDDFDFEFAMVKLTEGLFGVARVRAIYAYLRDTWELPGIPADGEASLAIVGSPFGDADIHRIPFLSGSNHSIMFNSSSAGAPGPTIRKDDSNGYVYYPEGGSSFSRLFRSDYSGANRILVTTNSPSGAKTKGFAINLIADEAYVSHGVAGNAISKRSLDPADTAQAWTQIFASGTYEINFAIEYNPNDDLIYFIDSLAATPTLRTIETDGSNDTLVKSLTAGKVYEYLCKDPDANVLYFTNATDNTIEKYDIDTDTWTTSWHTPTNKPNGIDIQVGKLWYYEETTFIVYEVDLSTPGSKTNKGNASGTGDAAGLAVIVFDTTA